MDAPGGVDVEWPSWYLARSWHWIGGGPDPRLLQSIGRWTRVVQLSEANDEAGSRAKARALEFFERAKHELDRHWARNEAGWAWFHAGMLEELRLNSPAQLALREVELMCEAKQKLKDSWRWCAIEGYAAEPPGALERVVRTQSHLQQHFENDNRKRLLQRSQLIVYLAVLVGTFLLIGGVEFAERGLLLRDDQVDGWWVLSAALYGTLGGGFSSAQRVAAAGASARFPELRWAQLANAFRPLAGGAGALIAFAALQSGLIGEAGQSGPRVALFCFLAGFSERFIPGLTAKIESAATSAK